MHQGVRMSEAEGHGIAMSACNLWQPIGTW